MMTAKPTGHYMLKPDGLYLQFDRLFYAPIEEVWYTLTNPTAMQAWIGTYTGSPATGAVKFRMSFEEGSDWQNVSILEWQPPHRFIADSREGSAPMRVYCHLVEGGGMTTLTFGSRLQSAADAATMGPGWDYYLDRLVAAHSGHTMPEWEQYSPAFSDYYRRLQVPDAARS